MFLSKLSPALLLFALVMPAAAADVPHFGQPVTEADIAPWDISIMPNGAGLPAGSGTVAQGEKVYAEKCEACHGDKGGGRPSDRLVGGFGTLAGADKVPVKTVGSYWPYPTTFFDYVRRAMPWNAPKSLTNDEVYSLAAYIFNLNNIVPAEAVMNADTLPKVNMPNRDGFIPFPRTKF